MSSPSGQPRVVWGPMSYHAIVTGRVFSERGAEFPDQPFEFYQHVDEFLAFLKQAFLTFCFLLSALARVAPTLFLFPLLLFSTQSTHHNPNRLKG